MSAPRPTYAQDDALLLLSHGWVWVNNSHLYGWRRVRQQTLDALVRNGWAELRHEPDGRIEARITLAGRIAGGFPPVMITKPGIATFVKGDGKTFVACDARDGAPRVPNPAPQYVSTENGGYRNVNVPRAKRLSNRLRPATLTAEVGTQIAWAYWDGSGSWGYDLVDEVSS